MSAPDEDAVKGHRLASSRPEVTRSISGCRSPRWPLGWGARQSLNRAVSFFTRRGWIVLEGSTVRLKDRDAIERFATS